MVLNELRIADELLELRPMVAVEENAKQLENFQNATLRPILKYQSDLLASYFMSNTHAILLLKRKPEGENI